MSTLELRTGRVYRAKKPAPAGSVLGPVFNDRQIIWYSAEAGTVQYDGPAVPIGRHYPKVSVEKFLAWAKEDVTDRLPTDGWESYQK